jgi:hypothetical protein
MTHKIPDTLLGTLTKGPSATKTAQVAAMQTYIQGLLTGTHHTFLQGSYRNDTAISDINDVDIVAVRLETYSGVFAPRSNQNWVHWNTIFSEIEEKLRAQKLYTWTVERGDKCIKVRGAFNADVVPAVQIRDHLTDPVVVFSFKTDTEKINSPRDHYKNGVLKSEATSGRYKPTVRMFKNWARNHFGADTDVVSSFKIEALVHAMPHNHFLDDYATNFILGANGMVEKLEPRGFVLPTIQSVSGDEIITQTWDIPGRTAFVGQLKESLAHALLAYNSGSTLEADQKWRTAFSL